MEKHLFDRLVESMMQMDEIDRGERQPSRELDIGTTQVKKTQHAAGPATKNLLSASSDGKKLSVDPMN